MAGPWIEEKRIMTAVSVNWPKGAFLSLPKCAQRPICRTRLKYELKLGLGKVRTLGAKYELRGLDLSSDLAKYYFVIRAMSVLTRFQVVLNQVVLKVPKYELK